MLTKAVSSSNSEAQPDRQLQKSKVQGCCNLGNCVQFRSIQPTYDANHTPEDQLEAQLLRLETQSLLAGADFTTQLAVVVNIV